MDDEKKAKLAAIQLRAEQLNCLVKEGDVLTHTRCMGYLEEHSFCGWDGLWIVGIPTKDTMKHGKLEGKDTDNLVNDISPGHVSHINRIPVDSAEFLASFDQHKNVGMTNEQSEK